MSNIDSQIRALESEIAAENAHIHQQINQMTKHLSTRMVVVAISASLIAGFFIARKKNTKQLVHQAFTLTLRAKQFSNLITRYLSFFV